MISLFANCLGAVAVPIRLTALLEDSQKLIEHIVSLQIRPRPSAPPAPCSPRLPSVAPLSSQAPPSAEGAEDGCIGLSGSMTLTDSPSNGFDNSIIVIPHGP